MTSCVVQVHVRSLEDVICGGAAAKMLLQSHPLSLQRAACCLNASYSENTQTLLKINTKCHICHLTQCQIWCSYSLTCQTSRPVSAPTQQLLKQHSYACSFSLIFISCWNGVLIVFCMRLLHFILINMKYWFNLGPFSFQCSGDEI